MGTREKFSIFDVGKLVNSLKKFSKVVFNIVLKRGQILFIEKRNIKGFKELTKVASFQCQAYFIGEWTYGLITNVWMAKLYLNGEIFEGETEHNIKKKPSLVFLTDVNKATTIVNEVIKTKIPIFGLSSNVNISDNIAYFVAGNTGSSLSLYFFCTLMALFLRTAIFLTACDHKNINHYSKKI
jgi:ribosomal protein S2